MLEREGLTRNIPVARPASVATEWQRPDLLSCRSVEQRVRIKSFLPLIKQKALPGLFDLLAEREGFEPSDRVNGHSISSRAHSTTLAPLRFLITTMHLTGILHLIPLNQNPG